MAPHLLTAWRALDLSAGEQSAAWERSPCPKTEDKSASPIQFAGRPTVDQTRPTMLSIVIKTTTTHTITYTLMGLLASTLLDYRAMFTAAGLNCLMRSFDDPLLVAAPLYQPLRGALFGFIFYLLRQSFFGPKRGWLVMWATLVGLGILGTFGPAPGSLEGLFFTVVPVWAQVRGLPEVLLQSLLLSGALHYWVNTPEKRWLNWAAGLGFVLLLALPVIGLLVGPGN